MTIGAPAPWEFSCAWARTRCNDKSVMRFAQRADYAVAQLGGASVIRDVSLRLVPTSAEMIARSAVHPGTF
jgi:hypothetical protein